MERDIRWAQVTASIGEPDYDIVEAWPPPGKYLQYRIEVRYQGWTYWQTQLVDIEMTEDDDLPWDGAERDLLDAMVIQIDERLAHDKPHISLTKGWCLCLCSKCIVDEFEGSKCICPDCSGCLATNHISVKAKGLSNADED